MGKVTRGLRGGLLVLLALVVAVAASAQPPGADKGPTLKTRIATTTKQKEALVQQFLEALGPAMRAHLATGQSVALPGVGVFNVVRVAEHRNLVEGRVVVVPAANYIEFVPAGVMLDTANSAGAQPVRTVPGFEYNPLPRTEPGLRTEGLKVGRTRTR
jgi:nucleoid DNA-binding protein